MARYFMTDPVYADDLVLSIISVSVETMKIVDNLPKLDFNSVENKA